MCHSYAAAIIALANAVYGLFFVPESLDMEHRRAFSWRRANPFGVLKKISAMPKLGWFLAALFLFFLRALCLPKLILILHSREI